jgi:hypothetical protein
MGPKSNMVIVQTILLYNIERRREFNTLKEQLKTCCCFPTRRKISMT